MFYAIFFLYLIKNKDKMDIVQRPKVNKKIAEILDSFVMEMNDDVTRQKIAYKIKCFLEDEKIDSSYVTLNLYTPAERIDQGLVDIRIDDELYPFEEIVEIDDENWREYCIKWEKQDLIFGHTIKLFQYMINEGHIWNLPNNYSRTAEDLIQEGYCTLSYKETKGHYIWGNPKIPAKNDLKPNVPGTDGYVQKRKELNDDEFFEWSNMQIDYEN